MNPQLKTRLIATLRGGPAQVKTLASMLECSESRVREILKTLEGVEHSTGKPMQYWIPEVSGEDLPADNPSPEGQSKADDPAVLLAEGRCPHCGGSSSSQTGVGEPGTFLGDACNFCHECNITYNRYTGDKVEVGEKKARKILNPQPIIDKKVALVEAAGGTLVYASRIWTCTIGKKITTLTSRQFAEYTPEELVAFCKG